MTIALAKGALADKIAELDGRFTVQQRVSPTDAQISKDVATIYTAGYTADAGSKSWRLRVILQKADQGNLGDDTRLQEMFDTAVAVIDWLTSSGWNHSPIGIGGLIPDLREPPSCEVDELDESVRIDITLVDRYGG